MTDYARECDRLVTVLLCSNHKVITHYEPGPNDPPCPENQRTLFAVQMVQADIELCIRALRTLALQLCSAEVERILHHSEKERCTS